MKAFSPRPRGAAAVEFALVLPLLLTILFGTIEWGYYFFNRQIVINSAREGARVGTLQLKGPDDAKAAAEHYLTGSGLVLKSGTIGGEVFPAPVTLTVGTVTQGTCPAESSCIGIVYRLPSLTGFLDTLLGSTRTIIAYAEMRK